MYIIYLHTNKINNKKYVGLTSKTIKERWNGHVKKAKYERGKNYFHSAIIKYGADNWAHQILETDPNLKSAEKLERKWIKHYGSNNKKFGYNLTEGGNVSQSSLDPRVRKKISKSVSKIMEDPEIKKRLSKKLKKWHKSHDNSFLGKKHSKESKIKMSEKNKEWHKNNDNPFKNKKHSKEALEKMKSAAKIRCAGPNWQPPLVRNGVSNETRKKMSESAKNRKQNLICTKQELFQLFKECSTPKEVSKRLGCSSANICRLVNIYDVKHEIEYYKTRKNKITSKNELLKCAGESKSKREMARKLNCTSTLIIEYSSQLPEG